MWRNPCVAVLAAGLLSGCVGDNAGVTVGSLGAEAAPQVDTAAPAPPPISMGPLLEGPLGTKLAEADRHSAFAAETQALASGERKTWRGSRGVYGYVVPGGAASASEGGECRTFTHTIYFAGRPQTGHGTGCRDPDGAWRITG